MTREEANMYSADFKDMECRVAKHLLFYGEEKFVVERGAWRIEFDAAKANNNNDNAKGGNDGE